MMSRPLIILLAGAALLQSQSTSLLAGPGGYGANSLENAADREIARRQEDIVLAEAAMKRGDDALAANDIENAYRAYKEAVDHAPDGSADGGLRARALSRFSSTAVRYAEYLVSQGEYARAESTAREVLEPRYNPNYRPAAIFLTRLEQPDYFNKTITPKFASQREEVEGYLQEANGYFDSGRYDLAARKYQQVLGIDKYNAAALRGLEQVELGKQRYYDSAYNETRSRMLWQVDKSWERPKRRFVEARSTDSATLEERRGTEAMVARLNQIIIPSVDITDKSVRATVDELKRLSRQYDAAGEETGRRGVNIVLKLPPGTASPPPVAVPGETAAPEAAPAAGVPETISIRLSNIPLYEALRYVATLAGLKIKIETSAVLLVPQDESTDILEDREFKVPPDFISGTASTESTVATAGPQATTSTNPRLAERQSAQEFLESQGVTFPKGASATFVRSNSRLVVRNTAANLELIEEAVATAMSKQPTQVEIESKFVEISQNNLKELGFDWALGPFSIGGSGVYGSGGENISGTGSYPFVNPTTGEAVGGTSVTSGLRTGSGTGNAVTLNSIDSLLAKNLGLAADGGVAPAILGISGIFTNPQFQVVIRALNQKKGVDLMAAPKVTTKSGREAIISINRIFPYPESYAPPQIPQNSGTANNSGGSGNSGGTIPIVTPSFPENFTTRPLGVTLKVTPDVGPDGYTIELSLTPEVVDFDGFINYGSPIYSVNLTPSILSTASSAASSLIGTNFFISTSTEKVKLTDNVINQPIFSTRRVETNVSIWDGQTVALGGLIREDVQTVNDKVPFLGDIPLAGVLFRSEVEQKIKKNLIIFVTARLMDAAGQPLRSIEDTDQEEDVEPLGLPEDLKKPVISAKGFRQK